MRKPLILWDIDGTLVRGKGGRVSVNAFVRALEAVVGQRDRQLVYPPDASGKTDTGIALETLAMAAIVEAEAVQLLNRFGPAYLDELERDRATLAQDLQVLPGVPEVLARLRELNVPQTLLTGNLEPIARLKLGLVELDRYVNFDIGAFGSDHRDRDCLVPIVRERVQQRLGFDPDPEEIIVIGDTPRDIACARAGGAKAIAVATGLHSREQLEAHAPDAVLDSLEDTQAVVATLLELGAPSRIRTGDLSLERAAS